MHFPLNGLAIVLKYCLWQFFKIFNIIQLRVELFVMSLCMHTVLQLFVQAFKYYYLF